jgi:predicted dehydrogenase
MSDKIRIGVIGYGYWGPNIVRNFSSIDSAKVIRVADSGESALNRVRKDYPQIEATSDLNDILCAKDLDAVAIVTPVSTHFELAKKALMNGKHVFVEKPFTRSIAQAEELIELAEKKHLKIMVDHTFIFTSTVRKIKQLIDEDVLGAIYYYDSIRVNLGLFQNDVNVIWDLAPHDFSIMDFLIKERPVAVQASGKAHVNGKENIAFVTAHFSSNVIGHFNVNWLSPVKVRLTMLGGEKKMLVWNDAVADEKLRVYDKGINGNHHEGTDDHELRVSYRSGDMWAPKIKHTEALQLEADYFASCILGDKTPVNDGHAGLRIIKMLEACDQSLKNQGGLVYL